MKLTDEAQDKESKLASSYFLDDLWARLRNFLNDVNEKGEKRTFGRVDKANKLKFLDACESFDITKKGLLTEAQMEQAFSKVRFLPMPSRDELKMLYKSLEAFAGPDNTSEIKYSKILEAPVKREFTSINGIFPKIVSFTQIQF